MIQKKRAKQGGLALLVVLLVVVLSVAVWYITREERTRMDLHDFEDGVYHWVEGPATGELAIPHENIDIRSFYVSADGQQIMIQNHHIRREADESGVVVSRVGNYFYCWEDGKFRLVNTPENIETPVFWTEDRIYFNVWDNGSYLYTGDICKESIENIRQMKLDAEEIYMEGIYAVYGDRVFFRAYADFARREYIGTIRGEKICDIQQVESIREDETVREAVFLGNANRILVRAEESTGQDRMLLIQLVQTGSGVHEQRLEVVFRDQTEPPKGLTYLCAYEEQDIIYFMDARNTIHKVPFWSFLELIEEQNDG